MASSLAQAGEVSLGEPHGAWNKVTDTNPIIGEPPSQKRPAPAIPPGAAYAFSCTEHDSAAAATIEGLCTK